MEYVMTENKNQAWLSYSNTIICKWFFPVKIENKNTICAVENYDFITLVFFGHISGDSAEPALDLFQIVQIAIPLVQKSISQATIIHKGKLAPAMLKN